MITQDLDLSGLSDAIAIETALCANALESPKTQRSLEVTNIGVRMNQSDCEPSEPYQFDPSVAAWDLQIEYETDRLAAERIAEDANHAANRNLLDVVGRLSVRVINGVDSSWTKKLQESGYTNVARLARTSEAEIVEMIRQNRSAKVGRFCTLASLLDTEIPRFRFSPRIKATVGDLDILSSSALREFIGPELIGASEAKRLRMLIRLLAVCIDQTALDHIPLSDLALR